MKCDGRIILGRIVGTGLDSSDSVKGPVNLRVIRGVELLASQEK